MLRSFCFRVSSILLHPICASSILSFNLAMSSWKIRLFSLRSPIFVEYSFSKVAARAHPMLHDEAKADASNPCPIVLRHLAHDAWRMPLLYSLLTYEIL